MALKLNCHHAEDAEAFPTAQVKVRCGKGRHTVGFDERGRLVFHDHPPADYRRWCNLEEIGGRPCGCLLFRQRWRSYVVGRSRLSQLPEQLVFAAHAARARHKGRNPRPRRRTVRCDPWPFSELPWAYTTGR